MPGKVKVALSLLLWYTIGVFIVPLVSNLPRWSWWLIYPGIGLITYFYSSFLVTYLRR